MDSQSLYPMSVHHGHTIRKFRLNKGMKQQELGSNVGLSQQSVSDYEQKRVIEEEILARFAKYFEIPLDEFKHMEEERGTLLIENNNFENTGSGQIGIQAEGNINNTTSNEKVIELYERLLKEEKEKYKLLEQQMKELKSKYSAD